VTDEGYAEFPDVVWESLESVTGDTCYFDITLGLRHHVPLPLASPIRPLPSAPPAFVRPPPEIVQDSDEAFARVLQEQETKQVQRAKEQREVQKQTEERESGLTLDSEGLRVQAAIRANEKHQANEAFWEAEAAREAREQASRR